MIDFEFEFKYSEESFPVLRQTSGSIPSGRCVVLCGKDTDGLGIGEVGELAA